MKVTATGIAEVKVIEPKVFGDNRGYFVEVYSEATFAEKVAPVAFVQDNESRSTYGVIRGMHYQIPPFAQAKLIRVVLGEVLDVVVDIREHSPTFGQHVSIRLSAENKRMVFVPHGFAHGFAVLSDSAIFNYKCDNYYEPSAERSISIADPQLDIQWPIPMADRVLSEKDSHAPYLGDVEMFPGQ